MALKPREISFIDHYFENGFNGTRAVEAVHKGIKGPSARTQAWMYLTRPDIKDEVERRLKAHRAQRRMKIDDVADLLQDFAEVDVLDIFTEDGDLRDLTDIPPAARRAIASIEVEERFISKGRDEEPMAFKVKKIKMVDKKGAAELLGKYHKMFTDNVEVNGRVVSFSIGGIKK